MWSAYRAAMSFPRLLSKPDIRSSSSNIRISSPDGGRVSRFSRVGRRLYLPPSGLQNFRPPTAFIRSKHPHIGLTPAAVHGPLGKLKPADYLHDREALVQCISPCLPIPTTLVQAKHQLPLHISSWDSGKRTVR